MYLAGIRARLVAVLLIAAACTESPPTAISETDVAEDLAFIMPPLTAEQLVADTTIALDVPSGPMGHPEPPPPDADDPYVEPPTMVAAVWNHQTRANFVSGALSAIGSHNYQGNVGTISTTGTVRYQGQVIGTQTAYTEQTFPFLIDFGMIHFIWAEARIYVDTSCGLSGFGNSEHGAHWQAVMGGPVMQFNQVTRSSISTNEYQDACPTQPTTFAGGGGGSDDFSGDRVICYFWLEYDLYTGEILDYWLMYCSGGG